MKRHDYMQVEKKRKMEDEGLLFVDLDDDGVGDMPQEEVEFEEEEEADGVTSVSVVVKKKRKTERASKEETALARLQHRAFLTCCVAHVAHGSREADRLVAQMGEKQKEANLKRIAAVLQKRYRAEIGDAASEMEVFASLCALVRGSFEMECRICFAPHFWSWKPVKKKETKTRRKKKTRARKVKRRSTGKGKRRRVAKKEEKDDDEDEEEEEEMDEEEDEEEEEEERDEIDDDDDDEVVALDDDDDDDDLELDKSVYWLQVWQDGAWHTIVPNKEAQKRLGDEVDPLSYVFACAKGAEVREIAALFSNKWSRTHEKYRFDETFLKEMMAKFVGADRDDFQMASDAWDLENMHRRMDAEPIPSSLSSIKSHPTFILEKHLQKYELLRPGAEVQGEFGEENVYLRRDVVRLHTVEQWLEREAKVPIEGQEPAKVFKSVRGKKNNETKLFGPWQMRDYDPGELSKDGKIPRNDHGNVYLYIPEKMMPRGCVLVNVHWQVADKLGIECARAISGWKFKRGSSYPLFADGIVVAAEFADVLEAAQDERAMKQREKELSKAHKTAVQNWKRLIRRARVFKNLGKAFEAKE